ncbi:MAG: hypothetical protein WKF31_12130 [Thermoleophilaceae bacterium]
MDTWKDGCSAGAADHQLGGPAADVDHQRRAIPGRLHALGGGSGDLRVARWLHGT